MTTGPSRALQALALCLALLPALAAAEPGELRVEQVEARERAAAAPPAVGPGLPAGEGALPVRVADELFLRLPAAGNRSEIVQRGNRNRATLLVAGRNNATLQRQQGSFHSSALGVVGARNAVAVDQQGVGLASTIRLFGSDARLIHIQRGNGARVDAPPIDLRGAGGEGTTVVVDTPRGRAVRPLPR